MPGADQPADSPLPLPERRLTEAELAALRRSRGSRPAIGLTHI